MVVQDKLTDAQVLERQLLQLYRNRASVIVNGFHYRGQAEHPVRCPARTPTVQVSQGEGQNG